MHFLDYRYYIYIQLYYLKLFIGCVVLIVDNKNFCSRQFASLDIHSACLVRYHIAHSVRVHRQDTLSDSDCPTTLHMLDDCLFYTIPAKVYRYNPIYIFVIPHSQIQQYSNSFSLLINIVIYYSKAIQLSSQNKITAFSQLYASIF